MGDATTTASQAQNFDPLAEVVLGVTAMAGKAGDGSTRGTPRFANLSTPVRFQSVKAIVFEADVD